MLGILRKQQYDLEGKCHGIDKYSIMEFGCYNENPKFEIEQVLMSLQLLVLANKATW